MSLFDWYKKKETIQTKIVLNHKNGETITITVEGESTEKVTHIVNRIKKIFDINVQPEQTTNYTFDDVMDEAVVIFDKLEKNFRKWERDHK